jgi:hypothetical protein
MADVGVVESRNRTGFAGKTLGELALDTLIATSRFSRESWARYTSPMPPAPMGAAISYGPSLSPAESGMCLPELSLADQKVDRECITAYPSITFALARGRRTRRAGLQHPPWPYSLDSINFTG